jgi:ribosomal protein S12
VRIRIVQGTVVTWVLPASGACLAKQQELVVAASSTSQINAVRFELDGRQIAVANRSNGVWTAHVSTAGTAIGKHTLAAIASVAKGAPASARRIVRTCPR